MSQLAFEQYAAEMFQLYERGQYAAAYDWITSQANLFPANAARVYYWRICLAARTGQMADSLQILEAALAGGYWFDVDQLRQDPDLAPLQGLAGFESRVAICRERAAQAQAGSKPGLVVLTPDPAGEPWPLLLALHGHGINLDLFEDRFLRYWRAAAAAGWLVAAPQSAHLTAPDSRGWSDYKRATAEIQAHLEWLNQKYRVDSSRVVVGGFSRGAELAAVLALGGAVAARGFLAVAQGGPVSADPARWQALIDGSSRRPRGYLVAGEADPISLRSARALLGVLESNALAGAIEVHPNLKHDFPPEFELSLAAALKFILGN